MGVPCRGCGREYDATLFEFGRTLWCTCGRRVGIEPRVRQLAPLPEKRFIADAMLGRLARWLRLLGFDCAWEPEIDDALLVRRAVEEERILLSRDAALPREWWVPWIYLVESEELEGQVEEVVRRFELAGSVCLLSRCAECNRALEAVRPQQVSGRVPARILETHEAFSRCPGCGRVYWEGSHAERIRSAVDRILASLRPATDAEHP